MSRRTSSWWRSGLSTSLWTASTAKVPTQWMMMAWIVLDQGLIAEPFAEEIRYDFFSNTRGHGETSTKVTTTSISRRWYLEQKMNTFLFLSH
mmetsp:Transcript_25291/g.43065  ORF Transcript_25291/g.43065 Transcript_25291/m.43065 type:complete len:92 (-) Transcript_25291:365-640(-)